MMNALPTPTRRQTEVLDLAQYDDDTDGTLEDSERTYLMYDDRWRVVASFSDQDEAPADAFVHHNAGIGGSGGSSYIDSVILRDRDTDDDEVLEERRYYCQNWRADVVAIAKSDGTPLEKVRYLAYGEPTVYPVADLNMDGVVNNTDVAVWNLGEVTGVFAAAPDADLNCDGDPAHDWDIELFYESYNANTGASGVGRVSSADVGNRIGYAGYEWGQVVRVNHVRYRVYFPELGRWTRRDPLGYFDGKAQEKTTWRLPWYLKPFCE